MAINHHLVYLVPKRALPRHTFYQDHQLIPTYILSSKILSGVLEVARFLSWDKDKEISLFMWKQSSDITQITEIRRNSGAHTQGCTAALISSIIHRGCVKYSSQS